MVNIRKLLSTYKNIDHEILRSYKEAQDVIIFNDDDKDLFPIPVSTKEVIKKNFEALCKKPFPEKDLWLGYDEELWHKIDGFGLPAKEQKFKHTELPIKLKNLQNTCETYEQIYDALEANPDYYAKEKKFIQQEWHRRLYGYWFFNNGIPTYMDGWCYFFLNYWNLDIGLPDYRDRDRIWFIFNRYAYNTTEAYYKYKCVIKGVEKYSSSEEEYSQWYQNGLNPEREGYLIDIGIKTCFGINYPKGRRDGATFRGQSMSYEIGSRSFKSRTGLQSMDEKHSTKAFKDKLLAPMKEMVFFFKPMVQGRIGKEDSVVFADSYKGIKTNGQANLKVKGLGTRLDYAKTAGRSFFDGDKLIYVHLDEEGKVELEDVLERWYVIKPSLSTGAGKQIVGYALSTSTVAEMTKKGGEPFHALCMDSKWEERGDIYSGQTKSGKFNLFIPSWYCLEGFVDEYGNSVHDNPTTPVMGNNGLLIRQGSKEYLEQKQNAFLTSDGKNVEKYYEQLRHTPTKWWHCFTAASSDTGFNMHKLSTRYSHLIANPQDLPVRGNFRWIDKFKKVEWVADPEGKFMVSYVLPEKEANLMTYDGDTHYPLYPKRFTASADPFKFNNVEKGNKFSKAGIAVFYNRDYTLDEKDEDIAKWKSNRFVCDYVHRTENKEESHEDMLMACIYYGAMFYPENNVPDAFDYFIKMGFAGYLIFDVAKAPDGTLSRKEKPGFFSGESTKQQLFLEMKYYIEQHIHRDPHIRIIKECLDIGSMKNMTKFDLFTAASGCLLGNKSDYAQIIDAQFGGNQGRGEAIYTLRDMMFGF